MDLSLKIDTVEGLSKRDFEKFYLSKQKPVIIKGLINDHPCYSKWTDMEYIKEKLGNTEVDVFDNNKIKTSAYTYGDLKMRFADFADVIMKDEPTSYRLFLFDGFKHCPELRDDYPCPEFFNGVLGKIGFMFFGGKSTAVRMHYDIDMSNVLHTQFIGRKRVLLFSPENNSLLYKTPFNTYSIANFENPDYEKFPAMRYAKGYDITLGHGDSLFMPSGYWHFMTYLEGGFGVAYRKLAADMANKSNGLMNVTLRLWTDKLMNKLSGENWVQHKNKVAHQRAIAAMNKIDHSPNGGIIVPGT